MVTGKSYDKKRNYIVYSPTLKIRERLPPIDFGKKKYLESPYVWSDTIRGSIKDIYDDEGIRARQFAYEDELFDLKNHPVDVSNVKKHRIHIVQIPERVYERATKRGYKKAHEIIDNSRDIPLRASLREPVVGGIMWEEINKELKKVASKTRARRKRTGKTSLRYKY